VTLLNVVFVTQRHLSHHELHPLDRCSAQRKQKAVETPIKRAFPRLGWRSLRRTFKRVTAYLAQFAQLAQLARLAQLAHLARLAYLTV
jgi:hypothetical protein